MRKDGTDSHLEAQPDLQLLDYDDKFVSISIKVTKKRLMKLQPFLEMMTVLIGVW